MCLGMDIMIKDTLYHFGYLAKGKAVPTFISMNEKDSPGRWVMPVYPCGTQYCAMITAHGKADHHHMKKLSSAYI